MSGITRFFDGKFFQYRNKDFARWYVQVPIALLQIVWTVCDKYLYFCELYTTHTLCHVFFNKVSNTFSFEKLN